MGFSENRIKEALDFIERYGGIDGAHHKQWVLDQLVLILAPDYEGWVSDYEECGEYEWDRGIAP